MAGRTRLLLFMILSLGMVLRSTAQTPPGFADTRSFEKDIDDYYQLLRLPGLVVGVASGDSLFFFKGLGTGHLPTPEPITPDHIFPIASLTKGFSAVALKQVEGEGKLSLNDPVSRFPNEYFTTARWTPQTTLAHLLSQTSESTPPGTQFVYNGSKYNVVFNAFCAINKTRIATDMTRPFTDELQRRILTPLKMEHTLVRFSEQEYGHLRKWLAPLYRLDDSSGQFRPVDFDITGMQSGPGFGMLSSVRDLVKYSAALGRHQLLTAIQYKQLMAPFYPGSPYGMGWFTTIFEGTELHWAYGYGSNDAALLLRVPSKGLTLVVLSPCSLPSASTRLGYGNPFNSLLVCSFFKHFLQRPSTGSRLPIEERFSRAATLSFLPASIHPDTSRATILLQALMREFPSDIIWQTPTAFELVSQSTNASILQFGLRMADSYVRSGQVHPAKGWYAGVIYQKNGAAAKAMACFERLAAGEQFNEQSYKLNAMMEVARGYKDRKPALSRQMLQNLVRFKDHVNIKDSDYREAQAMLTQLGMK